MIRPDGSVLISGRVVLKAYKHDVWIIQRDRLARVYIQAFEPSAGGGANLTWIYTGEAQSFTLTVGGDEVTAIFAAIVNEHEDVVFEEYLPDGATNRYDTEWRRVTGRLSEAS